jgi:hypothetical protein
MLECSREILEPPRKNIKAEGVNKNTFIEPKRENMKG